MPTDKPRISFALPEELLSRIDTFRFDHRIKNQSQAVIKLLEKGIEVVEAASISEDNVSTGQVKPDPRETELVTIYRDLNSSGQDILMGTARGLVSNPDMKRGGASSATQTA